MSRTSATSVAQLLGECYEAHADDPALRWGERWFSFAEVAAIAAGIAARLLDAGAEAGDRVVVHLDTGPLARAVDHALLGHGFVRVALSSRLHPREVAAIAADAEAAIVICEAARADELRAAIASAPCRARIVTFDDGGATPSRLREAATPAPLLPRASDDPLMLMYSSGTTGTPKGVVVTDATWLAQLDRALAQLPPITSDDVVVLAAPMAHFGGSIGLDCMMRGTRTVVVDPFEPHRVLDTIQRHRGTVVPLVPTLLGRLVDALPGRDDAVASVRAVPYGGSPVPTDVLVRAARYFPRSLVQFYGLAEALAPLTALSPDDHRRAARRLASSPDDAAARAHLQSAGRWTPGIEHRIVDDELHVRGDTVMPGYWRRDGLTAAALEDGWFRTGDLGETDAEGYLHLRGRRSELIISGGFNIHPREVEQVIEQLPGIAEVAVLGLPDERWGEAVHAVVVLESRSADDPPTHPDDLARAVREACLARIASYKKPVGIHVLPAIPRNSFGKVDRAAIRARFGSADDRTPAPPAERR